MIRFYGNTSIFDNYDILARFWPWLHKRFSMNWLSEILDRIKWKIEDVVWAIQDKIEFYKETKKIEKEFEELEVKPKKKKSKKKSKKYIIVI